MTTQKPNASGTNKYSGHDTSIAYSHILSNKHFLTWRVVLLAYFFSLWLSMQILNKSISMYYYFTTWTLIVQLMYHSVAFYATYLHFKHESAKHLQIVNPKFHSNCIKYSKYAQFMQIISAATTVTVVIVFWGVLLPPCNCWLLFLTDALQVQLHGVTMILTIIDLYICCNSISFKQSWWKLTIYGISYLVFSIAFVFVAGHPLYYVFNWKDNFLLALASGAGISVLTLIIHVILCWTNNKLMQKRLGNTTEKQKHEANQVHDNGKTESMDIAIDNENEKEQNTDTEKSNGSEVMVLAMPSVLGQYILFF